MRVIEATAVSASGSALLLIRTPKDGQMPVLVNYKKIKNGKPNEPAAEPKSKPVPEPKCEPASGTANPLE